MMIKLISLLVMWWTAGCQQGGHVTASPEPPVQTEPEEIAEQKEITVPQDVPAAQAQPQIPDEVNDLLDRLEKNAKDLRAFTAEAQYEKEDALLGRKELRSGNLIYQSADDDQKRFAILFDTIIINNISHGEAKHYIFDGRWLAEIDHVNRQFIKREVVAPGKTLDPLKLGEGPFPLPVGQPKADVLSRFSVTTARVPAEGFLKNLTNVQGLSLVPNKGTREAEQYTRIELFYDEKTLLPVGMHLVDINGDRKTIRLVNAQRNPQLTAEQKQRLSINEPDPKKWRISIIPWGG